MGFPIEIALPNKQTQNYDSGLALGHGYSRVTFTVTVTVTVRFRVSLRSFFSFSKYNFDCKVHRSRAFDVYHRSAELEHLIKRWGTVTVTVRVTVRLTLMMETKD